MIHESKIEFEDKASLFEAHYPSVFCLADDLIFDPFFPQMSHLYSMFAKQVQTYCKSKTSGDSAQCKKNMMLYGITKLNEMEESHLDQMDPYQRNANIIRKCRHSKTINPCQVQIRTFPSSS